MNPTKITGTFTVSAPTLAEAISKAEAAVSALTAGTAYTASYEIRGEESFRQRNWSGETVFSTMVWSVYWRAW